MLNTYELKKKSRMLAASIHLGKNGVTGGVIVEIQNQLKKKKMVKIKILKSALSSPDRKGQEALAAELVQKTGAQLVDQIGNVIVLFKKTERKEKIKRDE